MKRSEMLKTLETLLIGEVMDYGGSGEREKYLSSDAELILSKLEEAGMIPPMSNLTQTSTGGFVRLWTMKWEPEDEK